jgi:hypothetical protein
MFTPTPGDVHVNTPLTQISVAYLQNQTEYVATAVCPNIPVSKQSDRYYVYNKADFFRDQMEKRAPGAPANGTGFRVDNTPTYFAEVWAQSKPVPDQLRANADAVLSLDRDATEFLTQQALIRRERIFASVAMGTGKWATDMGGVAAPAAVDATHFLQWNDPASIPVEDIRKGKITIKQNTGYRANTLVIGEEVWNKLIDHPDLIDRVKYGQTGGGPARMTREALAAILEIDRVLVMGAVYNTADEGQAAAMSFIGGKTALLCHVAPNPGLMIPSALYTFSWTGYLGAGAQGNRIKRYRWEIIASDLIEIEMAFDQKVVSTDLGYFFNAAVA